MRSPVSTEDYASPNPFTGTLKKVEIDVKPANLISANLEYGTESKSRNRVKNRNNLPTGTFRTSDPTVTRNQRQRPQAVCPTEHQEQMLVRAFGNSLPLSNVNFMAPIPSKSKYTKQ